MAKVMLIEDDPTMISLLRTLLEIEGFEVHHMDVFQNVPQAVGAVAPDVVLMDVNLKGANGLEILAALRATPGMKQPKVILSSGMDYRHEAMAKGANEFVLKPYMPDELIQKIKDQVAG
ncbi:MAG: response regulator [Anaerolineae bacterium]|nr:MAG: response regulator [Anaerolineae bacterium]